MSATENGVLASILASKAREVHGLKHRTCYTRIVEGPRQNVATTLRRSPGKPLRLIAENKRKSPSAGPLSTALSPAERAVLYAEAGASMVSILCDEPFFGGSWEDIVEARKALVSRGFDTPVLAKEFIVDERQLREATACGADAILLIARILGRDRLAALLSQANSLGLESLVEIVTEEELGWAVEAGASIIGVNARDLDTLVLDTARADRVLMQIPEGIVSVHLSGLRTADDVRRIASTHAHAALIGETLMRQDNPHSLLTDLVQAAQT